MNKILILFFVPFIIFLLGCAHKVDVGGTEKPIALDVKMRVDIYHHVQQKANYIEDLVSGAKELPSVKNNSSKFQPLFIKEAFAQQKNTSELTPKMISAIKARRERHNQISDWQSRGILMEDRQGYLKLNENEVSSFSSSKINEIKQLINNENRDRKIIYQEIASMENITLSEVERQFALTHQEKAPSGTWIEIIRNGSWRWKRK